MNEYKYICIYVFYSFLLSKERNKKLKKYIIIFISFIFIIITIILSKNTFKNNNITAYKKSQLNEEFTNEEISDDNQNTGELVSCDIQLKKSNSTDYICLLIFKSNDLSNKIKKIESSSKDVVITTEKVDNDKIGVDWVFDRFNPNEEFKITTEDNTVITKKIERIRDNGVPVVTSVTCNNYVLTVNYLDPGEGVNAYYYSRDNTQPDLDNENWHFLSDVKENGSFVLDNLEHLKSYYIWVRDLEGNISQVKKRGTTPNSITAGACVFSYSYTNQGVGFAWRNNSASASGVNLGVGKNASEGHVTGIYTFGVPGLNDIDESPVRIDVSSGIYGGGNGVSHATIKVQFLNINQQYISEAEIAHLDGSGSYWRNYSKSISIPNGTKYCRFYCISKGTSGPGTGTRITAITYVY